MKIWRNPKKELPNQGEQVWMLYKHWKENGILGFQIMGGEIEYVDPTKKIGGRACSGDFTGQGNWSVYFDEDNQDVAIAWAYPDDLPLPEWNEVQ